MKANKTPIEDLRKVALKHYQDMSNYFCDYSSFVVEAIKAYNPELASQSEPNTVTDVEIDKLAVQSAKTLIRPYREGQLRETTYEVGFIDGYKAAQQTQAVGVSEEDILQVLVRCQEKVGREVKLNFPNAAKAIKELLNQKK